MSKWVLWGSRDPLLEFWDPLIYREWLKLETSNLAQRRRAVRSNEKNAKLRQKGDVGFRDPDNIQGTVEARNFKFGTETEGGEF